MDIPDFHNKERDLVTVIITERLQAYEIHGFTFVTI